MSNVGPVGYLRVSVVNGRRPMRRARRRARLRRVQHDPPVWSAESAVIAEESRRAVLTAPASLRGGHARSWPFRYFLDLPYTEIAAILPESAGAPACGTDREIRPESGSLFYSERPFP